VPSDVGVRTELIAPYSPSDGTALFLIETESISLIGPKVARFFEDCTLRRPAIFEESCNLRGLVRGTSVTTRAIDTCSGSLVTHEPVYPGAAKLLIIWMIGIKTARMMNRTIAPKQTIMIGWTRCPRLATIVEICSS
jgi:hypothetical protein